MQKDFHYYCIGILARAAGFNCEDALVIAYASQYTDDSTESELIRVQTSEGRLRFDPVRTSYTGLEAIHSLAWDEYSQTEWERMLPRMVRPDSWNSFWVHFHRAA